MTHKCILCVLAVLSGTASAQNPGTHMTPEISVSSVSVRGDTVGITYVVTNGAQSQDSAAAFAVDAPTGVFAITRPTPKTDWWVSKKYKGKSTAYWAILNSLPPGASTPSLYYESVGLPGIATDWLEGDVAVPEYQGADTTSQDVLRDNSVIGKTVGVEAFPADRSAQALLTRLRSLTQSVCASPLLWVNNSTLCVDLVADLDQAESYRAGGQTAEAKSSLSHYVGLLAGGSPGTFATGVTSAGYWVLKSNADLINASL